MYEEENIDDEQPAEEGLTLETFTRYFHEVLDQPPWRTQADKESDYKDGNQLSSDLLTKMAELGIPPAIEPLIGPAIESILGAEAKKRTDWRVIPDGDKEGQEVADALNYKLNQAERHSRADRSCSDAYEGQVSVGLGWVEVSRSQDPFKYPYRCTSVHRNEIWWDWSAKEPMLGDARYLIRSRWYDKDIAKLTFPEHAELLEYAVSGWQGFDAYTLDGGKSTDLYMAQNTERGWSVEEQEWRDSQHRRVRLFEVWTRKWENVLIIRLPNGRIVELDQDNDMHMMALSVGIKPEKALTSRLSVSFWAGPHKLSEGPSPYLHPHFPYVPFWGHREDRTGIPFGRIRGMMFMQDNVNASISKIRWGLSAVRTVRTDGAVLDDDEVFRQEIARVDADIILDQKHMAQPGAMFNVERDFQLNEQQYKMLQDARAAIQRIGGVSDEFQGNQGTATSGVQYNSMIEQSQQSLANIDDNFSESRTQVGELLLAMIIQDSQEPEDVLIEGKAIREDRVVSLNTKVMDEDGVEYLNNDVSRTMLKVTLSDVPSTPSFRVQQLTTMGEAYKSAPPDYQAVMFPYMMNLLDIPNKEDIVKAIKEKEANAGPSPEQQEIEAKLRELDIKAKQAEAQIKLLEAQTMATKGKTLYELLQTGQVVASVPGVVPISDSLAASIGFQDANGAPIAQEPSQPMPMEPVPQNTSPMYPPVPQSAGQGIGAGIETQQNDGVIQQ